MKQEDIRYEVTASGKVTSPTAATLRFAVPGKITSLPIPEGSSVKKGQAIAVIESERYHIAVREAQWTFQAAQAQFDKYYDEARGRSTETFDQRISRTTIDATHNNAYEELLKAQRNLRDTILVSPVSGTLIKLPVHVGDEIQVTTEIANVVDLSSLQFSADIDEADIGKVASDQRATLTLDAYPDETTKSSIKKIGQSSTISSTGATAYTVDFELPANAKYRLGMNGDVVIITREVKGALVVPLESLVDDKFVWVKGANGFSKKDVKLGIISDTKAEILSGLNAGDVVVTGGFDELTKRSLLDNLLRHVPSGA